MGAPTPPGGAVELVVEALAVKVGLTFRPERAPVSGAP